VHEQSLIEALMRQIEEIAATDDASKVVALHVWCGALSQFTPDHFREHFERASADTVAEGAEVTVEMSDDLTHPDAAGVRLQGVEVES
jgi:hydrogenase nickel incorporation protein HypA/HybF